MRALGIPTRSVTNYDSAHDQDESMTIDFHFDEEGDIITSMNDSVWYVSPITILVLLIGFMWEWKGINDARRTSICSYAQLRFYTTLWVFWVITTEGFCGPSLRCRKNGQFFLCSLICGRRQSQGPYVNTEKTNKQ